MELQSTIIKRQKGNFCVLHCIGGEGSYPSSPSVQIAQAARKKTKSNPRATARGSVCIIEL